MKRKIVLLVLRNLSALLKCLWELHFLRKAASSSMTDIDLHQSQSLDLKISTKGNVNFEMRHHNDGPLFWRWQAFPLKLKFA